MKDLHANGLHCMTSNYPAISIWHDTHRHHSRGAVELFRHSSSGKVLLHTCQAAPESKQQHVQEDSECSKNTVDPKFCPWDELKYLLRALYSSNKGLGLVMAVLPNTSLCSNTGILFRRSVPLSLCQFTLSVIANTCESSPFYQSAKGPWYVLNVPISRWPS
jgi:hypothetical protein